MPKNAVRPDATTAVTGKDDGRPPATIKGLLFLFAATLAAIVVGAAIADQVTQPGLQRTIAVAVIALPIVLLAGRFAERRGWVSGRFEPGRRPGAAPDSPASPSQDSNGEQR